MTDSWAQWGVSEEQREEEINADDSVSQQLPNPTSHSNGEKKALLKNTTEIKITTYLTAPAKRGDTTIKVLSTDRMKVGMKVKIGGPLPEDHTIKAFGSIVLDSPLRSDYAMGTNVEVSGASLAVPPFNVIDEESEA